MLQNMRAWPCAKCEDGLHGSRAIKGWRQTQHLDTCAQDMKPCISPDKYSRVTYFFR